MAQSSSDIASPALKQFMARKPLGPLTDGELRRLNQLQPQVRDKIVTLRAALNARGLDFFLGSTMRSPSEQAEKLKQGRSALKTPWWHGSGRASDLYMFGPDGTLDMKARNKDTYRAMHAEAEALGFRVLGFKELKSGSKTFSDPYHVELREGLAKEVAYERYRTGTDRSADGKVYA